MREKKILRTMSAVGFEPTRISPPELESGALDRSAKLTHLVYSKLILDDDDVAEVVRLAIKMFNQVRISAQFFFSLHHFS